MQIKSKVKQTAADAVKNFPNLGLDAQINYVMVRLPEASKVMCRRYVKIARKNSEVK